MPLELIIVAAYILVIAVFLAVLIVAVLAGQRFQRRQIGRLRAELEELSDRLKSAKEREAEAIRRRAIEQRNRRVRELYEHGGC